jgi:hypothetical protein
LVCLRFDRPVIIFLLFVCLFDVVSRTVELEAQFFGRGDDEGRSMIKNKKFWKQTLVAALIVVWAAIPFVSYSAGLGNLFGGDIERHAILTAPGGGGRRPSSRTPR